MAEKSMVDKLLEGLRGRGRARHQGIRHAVPMWNRVTTAFNDLPESQREGVLAAVVMNMANTYILQMAHHLREGKEPYDALLATARNETELPPAAESKLSLLKLLWGQARPGPGDAHG